MQTIIENYITHLKLSNASENTIRSYRGYLLDFARFADKLDVESIEGYLGVLHKRQFSKASTRRAIATLKSFGKWMVNEGLLAENPVAAFRPPRVRAHIQQRLTEEQAKQLCEGPVRTSFPERDRLILALLYGSGLRCDEVASLRMEDILEADVLLVSKGKGDKQRHVLMIDYAQRLLKIYLRKRKRILRNRTRKGDKREVTGLFFALQGPQIDALSSRSVFRTVVAIAKDAGLPWVSPHDLRRAFATHMADRGAPHIVISRLLGHAKLSTTEGYIAAASPDRLKKAYARARNEVQKAG
jgi:site-specific recombinase XerD